ncbi:MLP-like protein 31 [Silene latifolia]|uniref:MLP-like protein 31 n=1 Tax=Silene latifolia TaxID=37657 RepID=UPI003D7809B1
MEGMLKRKLVGEVEIREGAGEAFHDFFANKPHHIPNVKDHFIHACDLHEGDYGKPGSTIEWTYTVDGKKKKIKQILEVIDEENKTMKFNCIGGDLMEDYDDFIATFHVIPVSEGTCRVVWTFEYVKKRPGIGEPSGEMDSLIETALHIDEFHHSK